jgi:AcrR family transcriptional regulator
VETRERIMRAAREVFSELGYDAATFQAIAVRADLTRPAINHYFSSKRVLYREVVEQANEVVVSSGIARARSETTLLGRLSAFIDAAVQADCADRSVAAFLVTSVLESQRHPELVPAERDFLQNSRLFFKSLVEDAMASGELTTTAEVSSLVELLVAVWWGVGFYAGYVGGSDQLETINEQLLQLLSNRLWTLNAQ